MGVVTPDGLVPWSDMLVQLWIGAMLLLGLLLIARVGFWLVGLVRSKC